MHGTLWSGHATHNEELRQHGVAAIGTSEYLASGAFLSALFENWESEFLQMSAYVMLTAMIAPTASHLQPCGDRWRNEQSACRL